MDTLRKHRVFRRGGVAVVFCALGAGCSDPDCEDQPPGPRVAFVVDNQTSAPLFFESVGCSNAIDFQLVGPTGGEVNPHPPTCSTCEEGELSCVQAACAVGPLWVLAPGARHTFHWGGTETQLTRDCGAGTCPRRVTPARGSYELSMVAFRTADCGGAGCDCAEGICWVEGTGSDPIEGAAPFDYPAQEDVVLAFE